jgi:redox-sensitive bicupin YhaK (pirin superfamily)
VLEVVPLGMHWPTVDPFLFCAHHDDAYPAGDERLAPAVPLGEREMGADFSGLDGFSMYHGQVVPGFPNHPHRGFETVTFVRKGLIDHADSLGAAARFGRGDVQWVTAGRGIVHSEMFPLLDRDGPNHLELFQIWLNLPADSKMADPHFTMLWDEDIPRIEAVDDAGRRTTVTVIAGRLGEVTPQPPPPESWAARADADVGIWHLHLEPGAEWELPPAEGDGTQRVLYVFEGDHLSVAGTDVAVDHAAQLVAGVAVPLVAGSEPVEALVLQGRPIAEPVARYGPFVMNTEAEIRQAFTDYQSTGFGGWPWDTADPDHGPTRGRFARHVDGRTEDRSAQPQDAAPAGT